MDTDFASPPEDVIDELVAAALSAAGERVGRTGWRRVTHGSAHLVVLAGAVAVRVTRTPAAAVETVRTQRLIDLLPPLPFAVPRSLAEPLETHGVLAVAQQRLDGEPHPSGRGDGTSLRSLLDALRVVDLAPLRDSLAHPHAFFGGREGFRVLVQDAIALLGAGARDRARRAAEGMMAMEPGVEVLTHGDLAGSNVLWAAGSVSGVIDWDLAAAADEAKDVAALATWHGWEALSPVVPSAVLRRARTIAATYPLQLVAFALERGRTGIELERAVERAAQAYSR